MGHIWFHYFVPSLEGNGPEDSFHVFVEVVIFGGLARALQLLHRKHDALHDKVDRHHREHMAALGQEVPDA